MNSVSPLRPAAPVPPSASASAKPVRLVTLNIKSGGGSLGGAARPEVLADIAAFLKKRDADVIVLQEVDRHTRRSQGQDQLDVLARATDATDSIFAKAFDRQGGEYGVGMLLRNGFTLEDAARAEPLPRHGAIEPRSAIVAPIRGPEGERFTVVGTHLSLSPRVSTKQLDHLVGLAAEEQASGAAVIVAGDFNLGPPQVTPRFAGAGLQDAFTVAHPDAGKRPRTTLLGSVDHVGVGPGVEVDAVGFHTLERQHPAQGWSKVADFLIHEGGVTDHRAVEADVRVPRQG